MWIFIYFICSFIFLITENTYNKITKYYKIFFINNIYIFMLFVLDLAIGTTLLKFSRLIGAVLGVTLIG